MIKIALFLSGSGSNAQKIIAHFKSHPRIDVALLVSNKPQVGAQAIAAEHDLPLIKLKRSEFYSEKILLTQLQSFQIDFIALAGFLWLLPPYLIEAHPNKIVNLHPSLLPKYGGKGMYGKYVHEAVKKAQDRQTGITIHYANEQYDRGELLFQATCSIDPEEESEAIVQKVQQLEHHYFPSIIEAVIQSQ